MDQLLPRARDRGPRVRGLPVLVLAALTVAPPIALHAQLTRRELVDMERPRVLKVAQQYLH